MIPITPYLSRGLVTAALLLGACAPSKVLCPKEYQVDFTEAVGFAERAGLAYAEDSAVIAAGGTDSVFILSGSRTGARAYVQRNDSLRTQWVAFRGTRTLDDIKLDADYAQSRDTALKLSLHKGFAAAAEDLLPGILPHLRPGYQTLVTGHSLGGAIAAITGLHLQGRGFPVKVITFGQPKVTNEAGAKRARLDLTRYIHGQDIVALVPPLDWAPGRESGSYAHFGREVALSEGAYECLDQHFAKRYDPSSWWTQAQSQAVKDHAMDLYIARLSALAGRTAAAPAKPD